MMTRGILSRVPALIEALTHESLKDSDLFVRLSVTKAMSRSFFLALAKMGPEAMAAVPTLIDAFREEDEDVRYSAAEALAKIGPHTAVDLLAFHGRGDIGYGGEHDRLVAFRRPLPVPAHGQRVPAWHPRDACHGRS